MFGFELPGFRHAGLIASATLLFTTSNSAQQIRRSIDPPKSIVSLASAPRPQGEILARHPGDSTFEHAPSNYHVFAAATMGEDAGVEVLTLNFDGETTLTRIQSKNKDFVIEPGGTCRESNSYTRGGSCTLLVRFNPQGPGHRLGFVGISNSAEATPMSFGLTGNGYASVVSFTPSQITTVPSSISSGTGTISSATNLAIDGGDILYIADTGNNKLKEMDSTGVIVPSISSPIATPASLAVDSFGIVYTANTSGSTYYFSTYFPWGSETAYGYAYAAGACTPSAPCALSAVGMNHPANMSIDAYDNLFFEEGTKGAAEMPVSGLSGGSGSFNLWYLSDQFAYNSSPPNSFAVDANGNLYTKYNFSSTTCYILEEPLYNAEYSPTATRVAGGVACGFSGDGGQGRSAEISSTIGQIAFDIAGNLYFADAGNQRVRRIDALTGIISTIAGNGTAGYTGDGGAATSATLNNPTGVAVDSQGQVYIISSATTNQVLRKVTTQGALSFGSQVLATTSAANVIAVSNTGNFPLVLSTYAFTGANPGDFTVDSTTTSCILTPGATLEAGQSCKIGVLFKPAALGARSASLVFNDNTVTNTNTIFLNGTGLSATAVVSLSATSLSFGSETVGSSTASQSVTLTNTGGVALNITSIAVTGTNASSFAFSNSCGTTVASGASCTIHGHFAPTAPGAMTAAITITDSAGNSPQSIALSGTGIAAASAKPGTLSATSLSFPSTTVGSSSSSQYVTMTNTGTSALTITRIAVTGTDASSFVFANTCGASLAAAASCTIHGHFTPATPGPLTATITITDNATGSPQSIALSGTGLTPAKASLSANSVSFGTVSVGSGSASQTVTLTNTGGTRLPISGIAVTGADVSSFVFRNTCGSSLAAGASCSIHGHFTPTKTSALSAAVTITDNAGDSPQSISLTGTGQ